MLIRVTAIDAVTRSVLGRTLCNYLDAAAGNSTFLSEAGLRWTATATATRLQSEHDLARREVRAFEKQYEDALNCKHTVMVIVAAGWSEVLTAMSAFVSTAGLLIQNDAARVFNDWEPDLTIFVRKPSEARERPEQLAQMDALAAKGGWVVIDADGMSDEVVHAELKAAVAHVVVGRQ